MLVGYARVSTATQDHALQMDALKAAGCEKVFVETASGSKRDRPLLIEALAFMRGGDVLVVWKLDRLGRSLHHLVTTVQTLIECGIGLKVLTGAPIDTTTAAGKLIFGIFASLAEFERELIRERVNAGLLAARARGRLGGRPPLGKDALQHAQTLIAGGMTPSKAAKLAGVSRSSLYNHGVVEKVRNS